MFGGIKEVVPLKDYVIPIIGYAFESNKFQQSGIPVIKIGNIKNNLIEIDNSVCFSEEFAQNNRQYLCRQGDILVALTGATVGKSGVYLYSFSSLINQRVMGLREIRGISKKEFLREVVKSQNFINSIRKIANGNAQENISPNSVMELMIPKVEYKTQEIFSDYIQFVDKLKFVPCTATSSILVTLL